jgi:hypothetical protein
LGGTNEQNVHFEKEHNPKTSKQKIAHTTNGYEPTRKTTTKKTNPLKVADRTT